MISLHLRRGREAAVSLLAVGAHPDDIEIGAGGTLLQLAQSESPLVVRYVVLTGSPERHMEARAAASAFLPGAAVKVDLFDLRDGHLPGAWDRVKDALEMVASDCRPDIVVGPAPGDAHQDHRTIAEIAPTVFRDSLYLAYELPKWDGDLRQPTTYVPMSSGLAQRKVELLQKCFPSQHGRDWWDEEVFLGLARLRGMECRQEYAEAFTCAKWVMSPGDESAREAHMGGQRMKKP